MHRPRRGTSAAVVIALALCLGLVVGCAEEKEAADPAAVSGPRAVTSAEAQRLLNQRARAIQRNDLAGFLAGIDTSDPALERRQRRYFANMQALPLSVLRYQVLKTQWPEVLRAPGWGKAVRLPRVQVATQLDGFDAEPVERVTGFAIARRKGRPVVVSELTGSGKQFPGYSPAPWDLVRIHVRTGGTTLQLYDDRTWSRSAMVDRTLRRGIRDVRAGIPWAWDGRVVVYVFAAPRVLNSFEGVPGGNITHLGAMTFPIYAAPGKDAVAGVRFTLLPSSLRAGQGFLNRITRHELMHVAVGPRDDGAPMWFAEGLSEYMGVHTIRQDARRIATVATNRARGPVAEMPASATFNGPDQAWNYALAWMACDYIVSVHGEEKLWELMAAFNAGGAGTPDADQDPILLGTIGMDSHDLAQKAAARIVEIYG